MKSYSSVVFIVTVVLLVIICNVNIVKGSPFGLLGALSGSTQNAQNSISQGERNRSLEFVRTVLVTPLYGPGLTYKVGLLGRLFRQFSQIADNRPGNAQNGIGLLPNSVSKTLHFNRGITVTSPTQNEASITHATISTTEISSAGGDKAEPSKPVMDHKELDFDFEKDSDKEDDKDSDKEDDKDSDKEDDKDSDKEDDKDSEKDSDKDSEKDADKDSDKEDEKAEAIKADDKDSVKIEDTDEDKDKDSEKELENDTSVDKFKASEKELDFDLSLNSPSIALIHNPTNGNNLNGNTVSTNRTVSLSVQPSTNERSNFGNSIKNTNGSNDKDSESSNISQSIKVPANSINNLQADIGKNLTGTGGYHYAPHGYRITRNGPTLIFEPSGVINTLGG